MGLGVSINCQYCTLLCTGKTCFPTLLEVALFPGHHLALLLAVHVWKKFFGSCMGEPDNKANLITRLIWNADISKFPLCV